MIIVEFEPAYTLGRLNSLSNNLSFVSQFVSEFLLTTWDPKDHFENPGKLQFSRPNGWVLLCSLHKFDQTMALLCVINERWDWVIDHLDAHYKAARFGYLGIKRVYTIVFRWLFNYKFLLSFELYTICMAILKTEKCLWIVLQGTDTSNEAWNDLKGCQVKKNHGKNSLDLYHRYNFQN